MSSLKDSVEHIVDVLIQNSKFPKYQLERASEPLLAPFLRQWLSVELGCILRTVAMELPIRKVGSNQSTNVDYLMVDEMQDWYLVEVKTRKTNLSLPQLDAYVRARECGVRQMLSDMREIENVTGSKEKYAELRRFLPEGRRATVVLVTPHSDRPAVLSKPEYAGVEWFKISRLFSYEPSEHRELWSIVRRLAAAVA